MTVMNKLGKGNIHQVSSGYKSLEAVYSESWIQIKRNRGLGKTKNNIQCQNKKGALILEIMSKNPQ